MLWSTAVASAATFTITTTNDNGAGSLRQAIQMAASGDTINFSISGTITLVSGELLMTNNLTIAGSGATNLAISGGNISRVFEIGSNAVVSILGLAIRDGHASDGGPTGAQGANGGGIYNSGTLMLSACTVSGNVAGGGTLGRGGGNGGGIYNEGTLSLNACTLSSNSAGSGSFAGFGDFGSGGAGGHGGGIFNYNMLALTNCTVSANVGGAGGHGGGGYYIGSAGGAGGSGGGIYNAGTSTVIACTVSGNFGGGGGVGGNGFLSYAGGSPGGAGGSGGGIFNTATVSADSQNLLAALNSGGTGGVGGTGPSGSGSPGLSGAGPDVAGPFTSHGHNLIGQADGSIGFTNGINADLAGTTFAPLNPLLGPLANNGGPTLTMALLPGSPAIDAGDDALLSAPFYLATDQRGLPRRSGAHVDIGALELQALMVTGISKDGNDIVLSLIAEVGQTYRVEGTDSLFPAAWSIVADYLPGNGSTAQVRDTGGATHTQRFYRGRALP